MFELYYTVFDYCLLDCRYVMFQKRFLSKPKWGKGSTSSPLAPLATALIKTVDLFCISIQNYQSHMSLYPCSSINLCLSLIFAIHNFVCEQLSSMLLNSYRI